MKRKGYVTIHHVAEAAGVSVSTVSRVLNEKDDVAPSTYERVQNVINELGYASNLAARSMRSRRNNVIGLILPDVEQPFLVEVMKGVNRAIREHNYDLLIYTSGDFHKQNTVSRERYCVSLLNNGITDGAVIVAPAATSFNTSNPVVMIDPNTATPQYPSVTSTNRKGASAMMAHLIELGHQRIGFISGREELASAGGRLQGYKDGLAEAGIPYNEELVTFGDYTVENGRILAHQLLQLPTRPTAIFAANDESAFGAMIAAKELNLSIPNDLSVVGFDNITQAQISDPPLTTVDQSVSEMGQIATNMVIQLVNGKELNDEHHKVETHLIIRKSCKAIH